MQNLTVTRRVLWSREWTIHKPHSSLLKFQPLLLNDTTAIVQHLLVSTSQNLQNYSSAQKTRIFALSKPQPQKKLVACSTSHTKPKVSSILVPLKFLIK